MSVFALNPALTIERIGDHWYVFRRQEGAPPWCQAAPCLMVKRSETRDAARLFAARTVPPADSAGNPKISMYDKHGQFMCLSTEYRNILHARAWAVERHPGAVKFRIDRR